MHVYTILVTDYAQGWGKSALPAPVRSNVLPPDRPTTVVYEAYPKVFTPPLHFDNPAAPGPKRVAALTPPAMPSEKAIAAAERQLQRVQDYNDIENLQNAYGYYAEKFLWSDITQLFAADGVLEIDGKRHAGRERILAQLKSAGREGPVQGALDSQLQLQPVIHVASDGKSAKIRSRLLQLTRDAEGRPMWGGGIYENELVKENGVWKFKRLRFYRSYQVLYKSGWATPADAAGQVLPTNSTAPFHYNHPARGR
jgi:hypothetical protein